MTNIVELGQRRLTIEDIATHIGKGGPRLSYDRLPKTLVSKRIGPTIVENEYEHVREGRRAADLPLSGIYWHKVRKELVFRADTPPSKSPFRLVSHIYPRVDEGGFDIDTLKQVLRPSFRMAIHASEYGCTVIFRTDITPPLNKQKLTQLTQEFQIYDEGLDNRNKRMHQRFREALPDESRSEYNINVALKDVEDEVFFGIPYQKYIPNLHLAVLLYTYVGLGVYRSNDFRAFERFERQQALDPLEQYEKALMERATKWETE